MTDNTNRESFRHWAIVELFGHNLIAGEVSEQPLGGTTFIRVDVPAVSDNEAYTKLYHHNAVYAITPTDQNTVRRMLQNLDQPPIKAWHFRETVNQPQLSFGDDNEDRDW